MEAIVYIIFNQKLNKYHPLYCIAYNSRQEGMLRYKSKAHHTEGFENLDDAKKSAVNLAKQLQEQYYHVVCFTNSEEIENWDGLDTPLYNFHMPLGWYNGLNLQEFGSK